ncbi:metallopeptidase [Brevibacillus choshinensis]|uniref:Metallopeptidase n=1 Tax=Brevibacillus choshinensis TaxID=54911 RepID=A0ABR5N4L0_BRECH|nr:metallopeptidase [Brevibacillus choshinensis]
MYLLLLFLGPTIMIFCGLQLFSSVPITFLLFYSWLLLVPFLDLHFLQGKLWRDTLSYVGLVLHRKNLIVGSMSGALFLLVIFWTGSLFHPFLFQQDDFTQLLERWHFSGNQAVWLIGILMFINPLLEELYWRGFMHQKLAESRRPATVILLTAFFYSLYHLLSVIPLFAWPYHVLMVFPVFFAGIVWGYLRHRYRTIFGSMISHILADVGIMMVYLFFLV